MGEWDVIHPGMQRKRGHRDPSCHWPSGKVWLVKRGGWCSSGFVNLHLSHRNFIPMEQGTSGFQNATPLNIIMKQLTALILCPMFTKQPSAYLALHAVHLQGCADE